MSCYRLHEKSSDINATHQLDVLPVKVLLLEVEREAGADIVVPWEEYGEEEDQVRDHGQEAGRH